MAITQLTNHLMAKPRKMRQFMQSMVTDLTTLTTAVNAIITTLGESETAIEELIDDHATNRTAEISDGIINTSTLSVGSTPENVATTAFQYKIDGVTYTKGAVAAGTAWTAAQTINTGTAAGTLWGAWIWQINAAGTITSKGVGADQVYATEALAIAALPAADAGNVAIGYCTINANDGAAWTGQTDDITAASDCLTSTFYSTAASTAPTLTAGDPTNTPSSITQTTS